MRGASARAEERGKPWHRAALLTGLILILPTASGGTAALPSSETETALRDATTGSTATGTEAARGTSNGALGVAATSLVGGRVVAPAVGALESGAKAAVSGLESAAVAPVGAAARAGHGLVDRGVAAVKAPATAAGGLVGSVVDTLKSECESE